jgi:hypothetical protein
MSIEEGRRHHVGAGSEMNRRREWTPLRVLHRDEDAVCAADIDPAKLLFEDGQPLAGVGPLRFGQSGGAESENEAIRRASELPAACQETPAL